MSLGSTFKGFVANRRQPGAQVVITGVPELDAKLQTVQVKIARKAARAALGRGMTLLVKASRREVPKAKTEGHTTASVKKSIGRRYTKSRRTGVVEAKVGVDVGKRESDQKKSSHLLATGTVDRWTGSSGVGTPVMFRGRVQPNAFMERAFHSTGSAAVALMLTTADATIAREVAKL